MVMERRLGITITPCDNLRNKAGGTGNDLNTFTSKYVFASHLQVDHNVFTTTSLLATTCDKEEGKKHKFKMFTTPHRKDKYKNLGGESGGVSVGGEGTFQSSPHRVPLRKGLFADGIWYCNCQPRLPASHFVVKKEGPNKGKWFYTCQEEKPSSCGFFLWDSEADIRGMRAVLANTTSEEDNFVASWRTPETGGGKVWVDAKKAGMGGTGGTMNGRGKRDDKMTIEGNDKARNEFMERLRGVEREKFGGSAVKKPEGKGEKEGGEKEGGEKEGGEKEKSAEKENEFGDWGLDDDEERRLVEAVEAEDEYPNTLEADDFQTPRKAVKTDLFATPSSKRKRDEGRGMLPTPATGASRMGIGGETMRDEDVFGTPATGSRLKAGGMFDGNERFGLRSPSKTPTPNRVHNPRPDETAHISGPPAPPIVGPTTPAKTGNPYDISEEVMDLLKGEHLGDGVEGKLREMLSRHAMKSSGIAKGRDITRMALKGKDRRIEELEVRVGNLEREREMDRKIIRSLREGR